MNSILRIPPPGALFAHPARWLASHLSVYLLTMAVVVTGFIAFSASYAILVPVNEPKFLPTRTSPDGEPKSREDRPRTDTQRDAIVAALVPPTAAYPPIAYLDSAIRWKAIGSNFVDGAIGKPVQTISIKASQTQLPKTEKIVSQIIVGEATPRSSTPTKLAFRSDGKKRGMVGLIDAPKDARIAMKSAVPVVGQPYILNNPKMTSGSARIR